MKSNQKFGAKEVMDAWLEDITTGRPVIYFDTLKTSEINVTSEKVYARGGRGNPKLITWEVNKDGILNISDALLSPKSLELVSGLATKYGSQKIRMRQSTEWDTTGDVPVDKGSLYPLTADSTGVIKLAYLPKETAAEIIVYDADDDCGEPLDMTSATMDSKALTVPDAANKKVIVYYTYDSPTDSRTYIIDASHFSGTYRLIGSTVMRNYDTGLDEAFQIVIPNLKWSSNLNLNLTAEGEPSVFSFECEIMREASTDTMIKMIQY